MRVFCKPSPLNECYIGYILLNFFDISLTSLILASGGIEANPFGAFILAQYGLAAFIMSKMMLVGVTLITCEMIRHLNPMSARVLIRSGLALYFAVVMWECALLVMNAPLIAEQTGINFTAMFG